MPSALITIVPLGDVAEVTVSVSLSGSLSLLRMLIFASVTSSGVEPLSALAVGGSCVFVTVTVTVAVLVRPLASESV